MIFESLRDKLIAAGLGVALVVSLGANVKLAIEKHDLGVSVRTLDKQINDPDTGYVARLATCKANNTVLQGGVNDQNAAALDHAAKSAKALSDATKSVTTAQVRTAEAQREANAILNAPPAGATQCERVLDVDRRILESIK